MMIKKMFNPASFRLLIRAMSGHYRQHPWQLLLMWLGITLGVATVISIELLNDSARRSIAHSQQTFNKVASHIIEGDPYLLEKFYPELLLKIPGIIATPLLISTVNLHPLDQPSSSDTSRQTDRSLDKKFTLVGIDPFSFADFEHPLSQQIDENHSLRALLFEPDTALLDQTSFQQLNLQTGEILELYLGKNPIQLDIHSTFKSAPSDSDGFLIMDIAQAKRTLNKQDQLSHIQLQIPSHKRLNQPEHQLASILAILPTGLRIEKADLKLNRLLQMRQSFELSLNALSGMALMMGLFLVYNSSHFAIVQRQPILSQLRAMGITVSEITGALLVEYLTLAISAAFLAIPVGWFLSDTLLDMMSSGLIEPSYQMPAITLGTVSQALLLGIIGCLLACTTPLIRAQKIRARGFGNNSATSTERHNDHWYFFTGLLLLVSTSAVMSSASSLILGYIGIAMMMLGCAFLSPLLCRLLLVSLDSIQRHCFPRHWLLQLSLRETHRNLPRTRIALMALMIAIATSYGMQLMVGSFRLSVENWLDQRLNAPLYLRMQQNALEPSAAIPDSILHSLRQQDSITALSEFSFRKSWAGERQVEMIINNTPPEAQSGYLILADNGSPLWPRLLQHRSIMISEPMAYHLKLKVADTIDVELDNKTFKLTIIGIYQDYGSEQGRILISRNIYNQLWGQLPVTAVGIYGAVTAQSIVNPLPAKTVDRINLINQQALRDRSLNVFDQTFAITNALQLVAVTVAFMGLFSSLLAVLLERKFHMRIYHQIGLSSRERGFLLISEGLFIGAAAAIMAIACGEWLAWLLLSVINLKAFGWNLPLSHTTFGWLQPLLLGLGSALLATAYPAWKFSQPLNRRKETD